MRSLLTQAWLAWTLLGLLILAILLPRLISDCPELGSYYVVSPDATHAVHRYYYACGGATVGFTQNVDVDGHTVFSTYGGGNSNVALEWISESELRLIYSEGLDNVQYYEPQYKGISINFHETSSRPAVTLEEIRAAREAAGY